jgi:hypothetical protein
MRIIKQMHSRKKKDSGSTSSVASKIKTSVIIPIHQQCYRFLKRKIGCNGKWRCDYSAKIFCTLVIPYPGIRMLDLPIKKKSPGSPELRAKPFVLPINVINQPVVTMLLLSSASVSPGWIF